MTLSATESASLQGFRQAISREARPSSMFDNSFLGLMCASGASLIAFALVVAFDLDRFESQSESFTLALFALINYPHIAAALVLLYKDNRSRIFNSPRFFYVAVLVPALLALLLVWGVVRPNALQLSIFGTLATFSIGWHFSKQFYGIAIYYLRKAGAEVSRLEIWLLKYSLLFIWIYSAALFFKDSTHANAALMHWISFEHLPPSILTTIARITCLLIGAGVVVAITTVVRTSPSWASMTFLVTYLSAIVWLYPTFQSPLLVRLLPIFHSIQYLMFVFAVRGSGQAVNVETALITHTKSALALFALGLLLIKFLPLVAFKGLEALILESQALKIGVQIVLAINIHHYFIDSAIWRRDNPKFARIMASKAGLGT